MSWKRERAPSPMNLQGRLSRQDGRSYPILQIGVPHSFAGFANEWAHFHNLAVHRVTVKFVYDFNVWSERKHIEKLRYMHRNPVKRGLVERPEQWKWSSFRSYLYGEVGAVRVNYQEWPLRIERRPVEKFNDESRPPRPLIRKNRE
jgi:hypothetical protein